MSDHDLPLTSFVLDERWRFRSKLGRGADGVVYLANDESTGESVAIKVYEPMDGETPDVLRARIGHEAGVARRTDSPLLVRVIDWGTAPSIAGGESGFMVMEYLEGDTLREVLDRRVAPMPPADAAELFRVLLEAVTALHGAGFVHRDLKPENVMVLPPHAVGKTSGRIRLIDFGTAVPVEGAEGASPRGTPIYCAPEIAGRAPQIDLSADVYTLGIILFELLTGRPPVDPTDTPARLVARHAFGELDPLPTEFQRTPIAEIYRMATEREPAKRYESASAMLRAVTTMRPFRTSRLPKFSPFSTPAVMGGEDSVPALSLGDVPKPREPGKD